MKPLRKSEVKRLIKGNPGFKEWIKESPMRVAKVRSEPAMVEKYYQQWKIEQQRKEIMNHFSLEKLRQKTSYVHNGILQLQTILEMMNNKNKRP